MDKLWEVIRVFLQPEPCHTKQEVCLCVVPNHGLLNFVLRGTMTSCSLCIRVYMAVVAKLQRFQCKFTICGWTLCGAVVLL